MKKSILNRALSKSLRNKYVLSKDGAANFRNFQEWLLRADICPDEHLFLSLFAFDGLRISDASLALISKPVKYENSKIGLGWIDECGRQQRIQLGNISLRLLEASNWKDVQQIHLDTLANYYAYFSGSESVLEKFTQDQRAWFCEIASGPLVEHFVGQIPMTALADATYARLMTTQAIRLDGNLADQHGVFYQCLEGWLEPRGNDSNPILIDRLIQICRRNRIDDRQTYKSKLLKSCQDLLEDARDAGPVTSLILSWVVDLIQNGTAHSKDIAISTIVNYVGVIAKPMFSALKHQDFSELEIFKFEYIYTYLIDEASVGQKKNTASAINSWHRFLVAWLDVPPLAKKIHEDVPISVPSANVIWEHEYSKIQDWLSNASMNNRLVLYLKAMFSLAFCVRIRINELLKLRLDDLRIYGGLVQISIRGTKSMAAKRRIEISVNECEEFIDLLQYRLSEGAVFDEFIFSDPNRVGRIYKLSKLYSCTSHLIKAVTGDPSTRFHIFSHTIISDILKNELVGGTSALTNPLHQHAANFGHYSILTSCSEYMHRYESAVRLSIDKDLCRREISSDIAARWTGKKAVTIRKRISRSDESKNWIYWEEINSISYDINVPDVCQELKFSDPLQPHFLNEEPKIGLLTILNILADLQNDIPIEVIAMRQSVNAEDMSKMLLVIRRLYISKISSQTNFKDSIEKIIQILQSVGWLNFDKAVSDKFREIIKLASKDYALLERGIDAWFLLNMRGYWSLDNPIESFNFIEFLAKLNFPVTQLAIAYSKDVTLHELRLLQSCFFKYFGSTIPQISVEKRGGRPDVYLMFSTQRILTNQIPAAASLSNCGINAIFFAIGVMLELCNEN